MPRRKKAETAKVVSKVETRPKIGIRLEGILGKGGYLIFDESAENGENPIEKIRLALVPFTITGLLMKGAKDEPIGSVSATLSKITLARKLYRYRFKYAAAATHEDYPKPENIGGNIRNLRILLRSLSIAGQFGGAEEFANTFVTNWPKMGYYFGLPDVELNLDALVDELLPDASESRSESHPGLPR